MACGLGLFLDPSSPTSFLPCHRISVTGDENARFSYDCKTLPLVNLSLVCKLSASYCTCAEVWDVVKCLDTYSLKSGRHPWQRRPLAINVVAFACWAVVNRIVASPTQFSVSNSSSNVGCMQSFVTSSHRLSTMPSFNCADADSIHITVNLQDWQRYRQIQASNVRIG